MDSRKIIEFPVHQIGGESPEEPTNIGLLKVVMGVVGAVAVTGVMSYFVIGAQSVKLPEEKALTGVLLTAIGEHRCWAMPEGTQVCLNTDTRLRYDFSRHARNFALVSGEATFAVHPDPRPLEVQSGGLRVRDLSTEFDVFKKSNSTLVTVIVGGVKVMAASNSGSPEDSNPVEPESRWKTAAELQRLQQIEFFEATRTIHKRRALTEQSLSQLLAWKRGRIDLNGRPLIEALEEFARYQPISDFNITDKSLGQLRLGGELQTTHLTDFLDSLERVYHIHHTITTVDGRSVVNLSRQQDVRTHSKPK